MSLLGAQSFCLICEEAAHIYHVHGGRVIIYVLFFACKLVMINFLHSVIFLAHSAIQ